MRLRNEIVSVGRGVKDVIWWVLVTVVNRKVCKVQKLVVQGLSESGT